MIFDIHVYDSVESTMDIARDMAGDNATEWTVVQAREQHAGRGRHGNQWTSPKGNLYQTIILRPKIDRQYWGQLSFVIAVALGRAIQDIAPNQPYCLKWPNDVLIEGQKLAGILIESFADCLLVGTGVNIEIAPDDRSKVKNFSNINVDDFRDIFLKNIKDVYDIWQSKGFNIIRTEWIKNAYRLNELIQARLPNITYDGVFEDLDETGVLLLRQKDGSLRKIHSGEILYVLGN